MGGWNRKKNRMMPRRAAAAVRSLVHSVAGTSAVEFALIAPALATMVVGISQVSDVLVGSSHMQTAARASIQYVLDGGSDLTTAESVGMQAWDGKPANATLVASEYCTCDGGTASCTQTCPDGDIPDLYVKAMATGTLGGSAYNVNKTVTETARVR